MRTTQLYNLSLAVNINYITDCPVLWLYSPGHNRKGAAAGPVGVQVEEGDSPRTAAPGPEDS